MDETTTKRSISDQESFKINLAEFEKAFREIKSELYMKRDEVTKLKSDLEEAHHENHTTKESLNKLRKTFEENRITMEMFMMRTKDFEPKYYEKRDALTKLDFQYKMETSKNKALREDYQKLTMDKLELIRKVDLLEDKRKRDLIYTNDFHEKLTQLKGAVGVIKSDIQRVKEEQQDVANISQEVDLSQKSAKKCQEMSEIINNLKLEKINLEEQCVKYKAKSEKLESFMSANARLVEEENLEARVILAQLKKSSDYYRQQITTKNDILTKLNDNLCREREINVKLIEDNENKSNQINKMEAIIRCLESKLEYYEPNKGVDEPETSQKSSDLAIIIKSEIDEPIMIEDSQ